MSCIFLANVQADADGMMRNSEQEHFRSQESSHVDDRTQHEVYLHPFMRSVMAGVASVMCSYSKCCLSFIAAKADSLVADQVNATWACEDDRTLNEILKGELGFQGFVMTDWGAQHSTISAIAGLDVSSARASILAFVLNRFDVRRRCLCQAMLTWVVVLSQSAVIGART